MNFLRKLFSKAPKSDVYNYSAFAPTPAKIKRYPENAKGDFYVENEACITCGASEDEGQGLIVHSTTDHCYFKRQPEANEEIEHAIRAIWVSCIGALRYGGKDENILRKMYELGLSGYCDCEPKGDYSLVIRNIVTFCLEGPAVAMGKTIADEFVNRSFYKVVDFLIGKEGDFSFALRWANLGYGNFIKGEVLDGNFYMVTIAREKGGDEELIVRTAETIHEVLSKNPSISNIAWYENDISLNAASRPTFV